jgi:hypothetical protein
MARHIFATFLVALMSLVHFLPKLVMMLAMMMPMMITMTEVLHGYEGYHSEKCNGKHKTEHIKSLHARLM